jgi:hypothetical protein
MGCSRAVMTAPSAGPTARGELQDGSGAQSAIGATVLIESTSTVLVFVRLDGPAVRSRKINVLNSPAVNFRV